MTTPGMDFKFNPGDFHGIISHCDRTFNIYDHNGNLVQKTTALTVGVGGHDSSQHNADTPLGDYKIVGCEHIPENDPERGAYGPFAFYLDDLEGQERNVGRSGIMIHSEDRGQPDDQLNPTHGCIRARQSFIRNWLYPTWAEMKKDSKFIVSVRN